MDDLDIIFCDIVVTDSKGKKHTKKAVYCKADHDADIAWVLRKLKLKSAKSIEIIPIKKIGTKNA